MAVDKRYETLRKRGKRGEKRTYLHAILYTLITVCVKKQNPYCHQLRSYFTDDYELLDD